MDVMTAKRAEQKRRFTMKTFTIDNENNISVFASPEEAAAASTTPFDTFASQEELAELAKTWPAERLVATWNSLPGVVALKSLPDTTAAKDRWTKRIWARIQGMGDAAQPEPEAAPAKPKGGKKAKGGTQAAKGAPAKGKTTKKATPAKAAPKGKKAAKAEAGGPREGSKMAQVIALLQRANGASIAEIMDKMGWGARLLTRPLEQRRTSGGKARWPRSKPTGAALRNESGSLWRCIAEFAASPNSGKSRGYIRLQVKSPAWNAGVMPNCSLALSGPAVPHCANDDCNSAFTPSLQ
jgi:hypothetical protein